MASSNPFNGGLSFPPIFPQLQNYSTGKSLFPTYNLGTRFDNSLNPPQYPQYNAPSNDNSAQKVLDYLNNLHGNQASQENENFDGKFLTIPCQNITMKLGNIIVKKAQELGLSCKTEDGSFLAWGSQLSIDLFSCFVDGLYFETKTHQEETWGLIKSDFLKKKEVLVQKTIPITDKMLNYGKEIESYITNVQLKAEYKEGALVVIGETAQILDFMEFMYNLAIKDVENIEPCSCQKQNENSPTDCLQEISVSSSHRLQKMHIENKALELKLQLELGYEVAQVRGMSESIERLKSFMQDVDQITKKCLYPKYWNEYEKNIYTEIEVAEGSDEFRAVTALFYRSMKNATVTKLTRIQNKYLMDHYITTLQKRQEFSEKVNLNRQMLFHGTGNTKPEVIYRDSDTGFDLQFSKSSGLYGSGLYFAVDANYPHSRYAYNLGGNKYQVLLADVFVGKPFKSLENQPFNKAPKGYDSVEQPKSLFFIVYNNFHSYPLYLFEYEC